MVVEGTVQMFIGMGTVINVATVIFGSGLGLFVGHRLPGRTRSLITDALGLVTLLIAADAALEVANLRLTDAVGSSAPTLIVLGSLLIGGLIGSGLRIEERLESFGGWLQKTLARLPGKAASSNSRQRFIEGYVMSSLVFCVGPLTILGSINEGLGNGADQLVLKSMLDGFASLAFAASFGIGVMAAALSVAVVQGSLTALGFLLGSFMPEPHLLAITATGGLILAGVALRLLNIRSIQVGDLLPALIVAPLLTQAVILIR